MITFEEAFTKSLEAAQQIIPDKISVSINEAAGYVIQESIISKNDLPPFSKSAVDGFAILQADMEKELTISGMIAAGQEHHHRIEPGQCYRIMTGAAIPENAEMVVMQEYVEEHDNKIRILQPSSKSNIIHKAEDSASGQELLSAGTYIHPRHIGILATAGYSKVKVSAKPSVGVLNTGSELVEPGEEPGKHNIINSNGAQTIVLLKQLNIEANYHGITRDKPEDTLNKILDGIEQNDILIITGGVSEGRYDLVAQMLKKSGFDILFDKIQLQPGKPSTLAIKDKKTVIGLPGNPVSSYVIFKLFVEPFIINWMNGRWKDPALKLPIGKTITRKRSEREKWVPVNIINGTAIPVEYHGSAHIHAISFATHIMRIPRKVKQLNEGEKVRVRPL